MKIQTITAALAALTLAGLAAGACAAPGDTGLRAVRSPNGKDVFVSLVKTPKPRAAAETCNCPMTTDLAAMQAMCARMMRERGGSAPAPQA